MTEDERPLRLEDCFGADADADILRGIPFVIAHFIRNQPRRSLPTTRRRVIPRHIRFSLSHDDRRLAWRDRGAALVG